MFIYYIYFFFFTWCNLYWLCTWRVILRRALLDLSCSDSAAISAETQITDLRHGPFITGPRRHLQHTDECGAEKEMKSKRKRIVMTNETTRDWDDAPRGDTVLPPPSYTKGKWGVRMRLNAKLSADAASTEGQPHLFCTATWRSEKKIRRLGGGRAVGNVKVDFHLVPFFAHTQLKQRTCKQLSDRCSLWMCWIWNDGPQRRLVSSTRRDFVSCIGRSSLWVALTLIGI